MTELKTLKDFKGLDVGTGLVKSHINREELKQEAIKWVKGLYELPYSNQFQEVECIEEWIKHFFNITEEDLK